MGLLGQILGGMMGPSQTQPPPQPQQAHSMLQSALNLIHSPQIGGLTGLIGLLQQKGFGHIVSGWVSNGPNPPIHPQQLTDAIGEQQVQQFAQQNGMSQPQAANALSQLLPHVVDQMTPNGQVPQQPTDMASMLSMLKQKLM